MPAMDRVQFVGHWCRHHKDWAPIVVTLAKVGVREEVGQS